VSRLVIMVDFRIKPEAKEGFRRLIAENAAASLAREPGCRQFDVLLPEGDAGDRIVLYEIYEDAAAFDAHLKSPHFREFDAATAGMVAQRTITRLRFAET
jgi:quinol monooxygenase YgiN